MNTSDQSPSKSATTRREFLKTSSAALAGAALVGAVVRPGYTAENNTIKIALVGCGGRGCGAAAQALSTSGPTKLWRWPISSAPIKTASPIKQAARSGEVPKNDSSSVDGFKKAIDSPIKDGATPHPRFVRIHFEYAVQKGVNVFMEKSFAVDARNPPRLRREKLPHKSEKWPLVYEPPLQAAGGSDRPDPPGHDRRRPDVLGLPDARTRGLRGETG